jgi:hypothetical protein
MAIGTARLFGFVFPENFDYPYSATSITNGTSEIPGLIFRSMIR